MFPMDRNLTKYPLYKCSDECRDKNCKKVKLHWVGHKDYNGVMSIDNDDNIQLLNYDIIKDGTVGLSGEFKKKRATPAEFRREIMARDKRNKQIRITNEILKKLSLWL